MDIADHLVQSIGDGIAGLVGGAVRAIWHAGEGILHALQAGLPSLWLPAILVAIVAFVAWTLVRR